MKNKWLNLVLSLTNRVYNLKQIVARQVGLKVVANAVLLIILEIILSLISLPLYLTLDSQKVTAYFSDKGSYAKVNFDYRLRRILTVTGLGIITAVLAIKLILILVISANGSLRLYSVSSLQPVNILSQDLITAETGIQTARVASTIPRPELRGVRRLRGGDYALIGKGQPNSTVVLLLSDISMIIYTVEVDRDGNWQIDHKQNSLKLRKGDHSVIIFSYDSKAGTRSEAAPEQSFKITYSWLEYLADNIDSLANWSMAAIILIGVFLISLTI